MTKKIKNIIQKIVYQTTRITIREDVVTYLDGRQEIYEILQAPEGVLILPVTQTGEIILTKEYRHNYGWVYGVPMGRKEASDTNSLEAARRELREEIGLSATKWTHISTHHNGIHEEGLNHFYIAEKLSPSKSSPDTDEDIKKIEMRFEDTFVLMNKGKILDLRSRACIWAGYIHLLQRKRQKINTIKPRLLGK